MPDLYDHGKPFSSFRSFRETEAGRPQLVCNRQQPLPPPLLSPKPTLTLDPSATLFDHQLYTPILLRTKLIVLWRIMPFIALRLSLAVARRDKWIIGRMCNSAPLGLWVVPRWRIARSTMDATFLEVARSR